MYQKCNTEIIKLLKEKQYYFDGFHYEISENYIVFQLLSKKTSNAYYWLRSTHDTFDLPKDSLPTIININDLNKSHKQDFKEIFKILDTVEIPKDFSWDCTYNRKTHIVDYCQYIK